jgi:hypothetical protein
VEFCPDQLFFYDLKKGQLIFPIGFLDLKDNMYKLCDSTQLKSKPNTLVSHTNEQI